MKLFEYLDLSKILLEYMLGTSHLRDKLNSAILKRSSSIGPKPVDGVIRVPCCRERLDVGGDVTVLSILLGSTFVRLTTGQSWIPRSEPK